MASQLSQAKQPISIPDDFMLEYGAAELEKADLLMFQRSEWISDECLAFGLELAWRQHGKQLACMKVFHPG